MNEYSKMGMITDQYSAKFIPVNFSDIKPSFPPSKEAQEAARSPQVKNQQIDQAEAQPQELFQLKEEEEDEEEGRGGGRFGTNIVHISRSFSSSSHRPRTENGGSISLPEVVRRAFSMRKGSPVAEEGYCRIHDTADEVGEAKEDEDEEQQQQHQEEMRHSAGTRKGRIMRACKRLFRF